LQPQNEVTAATMGGKRPVEGKKTGPVKLKKALTCLFFAIVPLLWGNIKKTFKKRICGILQRRFGEKTVSARGRSNRFPPQKCGEMGRRGKKGR